jgi:hypothetical protein
MPDKQQRFQMLAQQFQVLEHSLRVSRDADRRVELLEGMTTVLVIEELDQLSLVNHSWLDTKRDSIASTDSPLIKQGRQLIVPGRSQNAGRSENHDDQSSLDRP